MKKVFVLVLALILGVISSARATDWSTYFEHGLSKQVFDSATIPEERGTEGHFYVDQDGVKIYPIDGAYLSMLDDGSRIYIPVAIENNTDKELLIRAKDCYLNDWDIDYYFVKTLKPGKKAEDYITVRSYERDIQSTEEVETIDMQFKAEVLKPYEKVMVSELVRIYPFS